MRIAQANFCHRVIPKAIICGLTGEKLPLQGGGKSEKSYIHARDLGKAIYLVSKKAPLGEVYNAGPENPTSIKDVVKFCAEALNMRFEDLCELAPDRLGQDSRYWLDSTKIYKDVGWKAEIDWNIGLKEMVDWGIKYKEQLIKWPKDYTLRA